MDSVYVIACNDSIEHVYIGSKFGAERKMEALARDYYQRHYRHEDYDYYRLRFRWYIESVKVTNQEQEHARFGVGIGLGDRMSRWFNEEPEIVDGKWLCPFCREGEMRFIDVIWPTGDPGYHHTCDKCGFTAAIHGETYGS